MSCVLSDHSNIYILVWYITRDSEDADGNEKGSSAFSKDNNAPISDKDGKDDSDDDELTDGSKDTNRNKRAPLQPPKMMMQWAWRQ